MKKHLFIFAINMLFFFAACESANEIYPSALDDVPLCVRAAGSTPEKIGAGSVVGVYMINPSNNSAYSGYDNVAYHLNDDNTMSPVDPAKKIVFPNNASNVNLLGYYPYQNPLAGNSYTIDDWNIQTDSTKLDLIVSELITGASMNNPEAEFSFEHRFCRMELNFQVDPSSDLQLSDLAGMTVTMHKQNRKVSCSLLTLGLTYDAKYKDPITFVTDADGLHSHAILPPTPVGETVPDSCVVNMTLRDGEATFNWFIPTTIALESGKRYTWNLTLKLGKVGMVDSYVISDWEAQLVQSMSIAQNDDESSFIFGAVDLGLPSGTLWASCNVGASAPNEIGDYYAWGELEPHYNAIVDNGLVSNNLVVDWKPGYQNGYAWNNYKYCLGTDHSLTKYVTKTFFDSLVDGLIELLPEDDVAYQLSSGRYCMPSVTQMEELRNYCSWEECFIDGNNVMRVTGPNGNFIILPFTGFWEGTGMPNGLNLHRYFRSRYLSRILYESYNFAYSLDFPGLQGSISISAVPRNSGCPIRPVVNK